MKRKISLILIIIGGIGVIFSFLTGQAGIALFTVNSSFNDFYNLLLSELFTVVVLSLGLFLFLRRNLKNILLLTLLILVIILILFGPYLKFPYTACDSSDCHWNWKWLEKYHLHACCAPPPPKNPVNF